MSAYEVLLLLFCVGAAFSAPLTDKEKQNRIVAVSKAEGYLLSAALSQASPDLLRVALTSADPELLETALTESEPELLIAALNNVDPDLLTVALTKSEKNLLATALTAAKIELLRTALNAPTNAAILEVALTLSTPELLAVALQDATVENLIVALTAADGSLRKSSDSFTLAENQYDTVDSQAFDIVETESNEEFLESEESIESDESVESEESEETNLPILSQNLALIKNSKIPPSSSSQVSDADNAVSSEIQNEAFDTFPAVPDVTDEAYGALSPSVQTSNADKQLTGEPYGALSQSVQTRLSNSNINKQPTVDSSDALSPSFHSLPDNFKFKHQKHPYAVPGTTVFVEAPKRAYFTADRAKTSAANHQMKSFWPAGVSRPVDEVPFFIPGVRPWL